MVGEFALGMVAVIAVGTPESVSETEFDSPARTVKAICWADESVVPLASAVVSASV